MHSEIKPCELQQKTMFNLIILSVKILLSEQIFFATILTTKHHQGLQSATANYNDTKKFQEESVLDQFKKGTQEGVKGTHQGLTSTLGTTVE